MFDSGRGTCIIIQIKVYIILSKTLALVSKIIQRDSSQMIKLNIISRNNSERIPRKKEEYFLKIQTINIFGSNRKKS